MIRLAVTLLGLAMGKTKLKHITLTSQMVFPVFLATFSFLSKLALCTLRRLRGKEDGINSFFAGFIGGLALFINKDKDTRKMFALYLFSRGYDAFYRSLEMNKIIPDIPNLHLLLCLAVNV